jgi:hydrogenase maturation protease
VVRLWIKSYAEYDGKMKLTKARCLILACGNTLRGDDGVGPWLAEWAEERFRSEAGVRVVSRQQWTPELAEEIAAAASVIFVDCATDCAAGIVRTSIVEAASGSSEPGTHHLSAAQLLGLSKELYGAVPSTSLLLTVGAGSTELGEEFSAAVKAALPEAFRTLELTVRDLLTASQRK